MQRRWIQIAGSPLSDDGIRADHLRVLKRRGASIQLRSVRQLNRKCIGKEDELHGGRLGVAQKRNVGVLEEYEISIPLPGEL